MENLSYYLDNISLLTYFIVLVAGVATSFTPCVYPLIPILIGVISAKGASSRLRNFLLSLIYVVGLALTFAVLGVIAATSGRLFGEFQTSPIAHLIAGVAIILFSLALLDILPLPTFLLSRVGVGRVSKRPSALSVFLMGIASGFICAPCTAAVLGALLTYVATTQNIVFGFTLLFTFALGFGSILIIVGTFAGILTSLSKLQKWMNVIQRVLALALVVLGGYFIYKAFWLFI
ncbi:MAG: sulfite exporter TauE/SafE family protein [Candidatus Omnitrophica bacterium]|nr:sulfite exporter TauE/SafE family protein [Candidatus Omnitrophota bacterium]